MTTFLLSVRLLGIATAAVCLVGTAGIAQAATATASMSVSTSIPTTCTAGTVTDVTIPSPATLTVAADSTATGTLQVTCTNGGTYTVDAGNGNNYASSTRRMRKGSTSAYLTYGLFTNAGRTTAFPTATQTGTGNPQTITIYAKLDAQTATEAGAYVDQVTLTVTY
ncbi:MAG TPA: spore coat protein U domain-containing protein [Variovorax sp.]|nr:spore coat protein U domain-containing protein [Variovorax sp.]